MRSNPKPFPLSQQPLPWQRQLTARLLSSDTSLRYQVHPAGPRQGYVTYNIFLYDSKLWTDKPRTDHKQIYNSSMLIASDIQWNSIRPRTRRGRGLMFDQVSPLTSICPTARNSHFALPACHTVTKPANSEDSAADIPAV